MAPVIVSLDNLSGEALSNALSQTVPLLAGASSMATTQLQRNFNQLIQSRQTQLTGFSTGEKFVGNRNEWATVFGNRGKQGKTKNVS
ncbi:MAG: autotransporter outer membrane beta-barrel domain-containing protein, partial [Tateyamaria sp.]|nr:autotransporter outer membrane beta-barrel domain-containing protein [Tateyamaria sp.]